MARFIASSGQAFGNWESKESLKEAPLDLNRPIRPIPVSRIAPDLAQIGKEHFSAKRLQVIGYDLFQVPVFRAEFALAGTVKP